jgi:hypothetical protein
MAKLTEDNSSHFNEPARKPVLDYFPQIGNRVTRFLSSGHKMVEGLKTLAWVVLFTLLTWIYAEREQIVVSPNVAGVAIDIRSSDPSRYVDTPDLSPTVNLQLTGPQQAVERVRNLLSMRIPHEKLPIDIKSRLGTDQWVNIVQGIQDLAIFKENGVTVQQSQPAELKVNIYMMGQRVLKVQIPPTITNLTADTRFTPETVTVSGPTEWVNKKDLTVYAKLEDYQQLPQGQHTIQSVPLEFIPPQPKLVVAPSTVSANAVVVASDVPYEITDPIPVNFKILGIMWGRFKVVEPTDGDYSVPNLHVKGPQAGIDEIKNKTFKVEATLRIEPGDAGDAVPKQLKYDLPAGVSVTGDDQNRPFLIRVSQN